MAQQIRHDDERLSWHGLVSLKLTDQGAQPWRIPHDRLDLFPHAGLTDRASMPSGVRLSFRSDTTSLAGSVVTDPETARLDLSCDGTIVASAAIAGSDRFDFADLPPGEKLIEPWLPQFGQFYLGGISIGDGATLAPFEDPRPRWITYGSSITHCRDASSPTRTWPSVVARERNLNLTSLGYGGNCHLEPMVARLIRDMPADFISVCAGINIYGASSLSIRTLRSAVIGFVAIVRERHPNTPLALISPICSPPRETKPNAVGLDLTTIRAEVAAAVDALQKHGDRQLHYIDGLTVFGPEHAEFLFDQLHPNAEGYEILGRNFLSTVAPVLFGPVQ